MGHLPAAQTEHQQHMDSSTWLLPTPEAAVIWGLHGVLGTHPAAYSVPDIPPVLCSPAPQHRVFWGCCGRCSKFAKAFHVSVH